jgi:uncharacterized protein involved in exopolysaccharide biosynthesis
LRRRVVAAIVCVSLRQKREMMEERRPEYHPPPPYYPYPYEPEDEINLLDYFRVLFKHKWLIIGMVFLAGLAAVFVSLRMTNIYRSQATIIPRQEEKSATPPSIAILRGLGGMAEELAGLGSGGSLDKFEVVLKSRYLSQRIVDKYKLMPRLLEEDWDSEKKTWLVNPAPTYQDGYNALMDMLTVSRDRKSDVMTIKFDNKDPQFAKEMADHYLTELSETLREETLKDAEENQRFLRKQLEQTSDVLMKEKISAMLAREIEKEIFARAQTYYSFQVLDPPFVPDLDKKVKPRRALICILSVTVAFFIAVFLAFFLEYIHNVRTREEKSKE